MSPEASYMLHAISVLLILVAGLFYGISKINYHIDDHHLRIRLGRWSFRKFKIDDIRDARMGFRHISEAWTNTIWVPTLMRKSVTIYRKTGLFKRVLITPKDPAAFVVKINAHRRFRPKAMK
ncbi:hypothetical protein ACFL2F_02285 [Myxococcota bacterium]